MGLALSRVTDMVKGVGHWSCLGHHGGRAAVRREVLGESRTVTAEKPLSRGPGFSHDPDGEHAGHQRCTMGHGPGVRRPGRGMRASGVRRLWTRVSGVRRLRPPSCHRLAPWHHHPHPSTWDLDGNFMGQPDWVQHDSGCVCVRGVGRLDKVSI